MGIRMAYRVRRCAANTGSQIPYLGGFSLNEHQRFLSGFSKNRVFLEQRARWRHQQPPITQSRELDRLEGQLERLLKVLNDILELAEELQQGTIEQVLSSDLELGIEALLRGTNGR